MRENKKLESMREDAFVHKTKTKKRRKNKKQKEKERSKIKDYR